MLALVNDSPYFDIVIRALAESLAEIGVPHRVVRQADPASDDLFLLCSVHEGKPLPRRYIAYNLEQLTTDKEWTDHMWDRLRAATAVWDYSSINVELLERRGIRAIHVPFGYARCMEQPLAEFKTHDVVFLGAVNESRMSKLMPLLELYTCRPKRVFLSNSCWGDKVGEAYRKSVVGVNMPYYGGRTILEVHRVVHMLANRLWVVSERGSDEWYSSLYEGMVEWFDGSGRDLLAKCVSALSRDRSELAADTESRYQRLVRTMPMRRYIDRPEVLATLEQ